VPKKEEEEFGLLQGQRASLALEDLRDMETWSSWTGWLIIIGEHIFKLTLVTNTK
jgi:hypothetical protein